MSVSMKRSASILLLMGFVFISLGFTWAVFLTGYPTVSAPDQASRGSEVAITGTSDTAGLRITIEDGFGTVLFDSDDPGSPGEYFDPTGNGLYHMDVIFPIPDDVVGPLKVTVEDGLGHTASKHIVIC